MKKNFIAWVIFLVLLTDIALANTTHYSYNTPVVGGSQNTWGTSLNTIFNSIDSNIWSASSGTTIGVNQPAAGSTNIVLTNPINNYQALGFTTTGKLVELPPMNATSSPVVGGTLVFSNTGSNPYEITAADGATAVVTTLNASQSVQITPLTNSTTNGTFQVLGPYLTSVSGNVSLGTSVSAANPANGTASNTGLYTTSTSNVGVTVLGTSVGLWNASGYNGAIGATTSNTGAFTTLATPSATIIGGTLNGTSIGATTSSSVRASTLTAGGITYPTVNGTNGQTLHTNGSGTASWGSDLVEWQGSTLGTGVPQGSTNFMWLGTSSAEGTVQTTLPSGTLNGGVGGGFFVQASGTLPSGQTSVFTLRQGGSNSAITCTITGPASSCNDVTHTLAINGTSVSSVGIVTSASVGTFTYTFTISETIP